jgi:two-component system sensor histidine kinase/response regulator
LRRQKGAAAAAPIAGGRESLAIGEELKEAASEIRAVENALLTERQARARSAAYALDAAVLVGALSALGLLLFVLISSDRDIAGRLEAQAEAELARARFKAIIDGIGDGVVVADARGRFDLFNPAAERILGIGKTDSEPSRWSEVYGFFLPDGRTPFPSDRLALRRALAGESTKDVEMIVRNAQRPDGVHVMASGAPIRAADGALAGAVVIVHDVSRRKHEETLQAIQFEVARALSQAGQGDPMPGLLEAVGRKLKYAYASFWLFDRSAGCLRQEASWRDVELPTAEFSSLCFDLTLRQGEGLPGRVWESGVPIWIPDLATESNFPRATAAGAAGLRAGFAFPIHAQGRVLGVVEFLSPRAEGVDGNLLVLSATIGAQIGLFLDQRRADEAAKASSARLQAVFDASTSVAIISSDSQGLISIFNKGAERILGWSSDEVVGKARASLFHDPVEVAARAAELERETGRAPIAGEVFTHGALTGGTESREWTYVRKDGGRVPVRLILTGIRAADGRLEGFIGVATDISEQKRAHEEMTRARDLAQHTAQIKSEFLANMSHEIRTPMNAIIGMTGLLLDSGLDSRQRDYAETVRSAGDALLMLINDILDFSKIEAGKMRLESVPFDLRSTVESAVEIVAERARAKGLELVVDIPAGVPTGLFGDPGRLRQVLINLLGNAVKFTEKGEVVARVERRTAAGSGAALRISVSDTGIGIPEQSRRHLFQSFTQVDASTSRKYGGTGLGLAISKQLVELMGGTIGVDSVEGRGSTFWLELVLPEAPEAAAPAKIRHDVEGLRVLIADDNAVNREILKNQLTSLKMSCSAVENGDEALERLRGAAAGGKPYALAIFDMNMPGMDGLTLTRRVHADHALAGTRMILLSSAAHTIGETERAEAGLSASLTKPVRQSALFDCISETLGNEPSTLASHAAAPPAARPKARRYRVLVVDDNEVNRRVVALQLERLGYVSRSASGGKEAFAMLQREAFDLVFLDCQMPDFDGYETTRLLREKESSLKRRPVIVAMTANALQGDREKCLLAGMDDYISKPARLGDIERVLARWDVPLKIEAVREIQEMAGKDFGPMVRSFLANTERNVRDIAEAAGRGDLVVVQKVAHGMRGSSGTFGAPGLSMVCIELVEIAESGQAARLNEAVAELQSEFERVRNALEAL